MGPSDLAHVVRPLVETFLPDEYPDLLVGLGDPDDAAVYRLRDDLALVATTDFFPPVVDDPYDFGAVAAANAMSDVYAMGGDVLLAINLAAFPETMDMEILSRILAGGADKVKEAGGVIAGGHTVTDREPKYGLAVIGTVHPQRVITKRGARPGDVIVLTKPLGTGVVTTALKRNQAEPEHVAAAVASMTRLNRNAAKAALGAGAHAMTDVTGYGLIGHAHEMAELSGVSIVFHAEGLPWLPGALEYSAQEIFPGGMANNYEFYKQWVEFEDGIATPVRDLLYNPETSGGLLIAVPEEGLPELLKRLESSGEHGWVIGKAIDGDGWLTFRADRRDRTL